MKALRTTIVCGVLSYRALFGWAHPLAYACTMLLIPLLQIVFFAYLGRHLARADDTYYVVGNAIHASSMAGIIAMTQVIAGERMTGTLGTLIATPANRLVIFVGRALPMVLNAFVVAGFGLVAGALLLDTRLTLSQAPTLAFVALVTAASCVGLGMAVGAAGLLLRDVSFVSSFGYLALLLLCGVNVPRSALPPWLASASGSLPLTHGVEAARRLVEGARLSDVAEMLVVEAIVGVGYGCIGFLLFRGSEWASRHLGTLERL